MYGKDFGSLALRLLVCASVALILWKDNYAMQQGQGVAAMSS